MGTKSNIRTLVFFTALFILILSLSAIAASAQDIEILLDGKPLASAYTIKPGQQIEATVRIAGGSLIKEVKVESSNPFYSELLTHALESARYHRESQTTERKRVVTLPSTLPSGEATISVRIAYDKDFADATMTANTTLTPEGGSFLLRALGWAMTEQTAAELTNWLTDYQIPRLDPELTVDDLTKADLDALGVPYDRFLQMGSMFTETSMASIEDAGDIVPIGEAAPIVKETAAKAHADEAAVGAMNTADGALSSVGTGTKAAVSSARAIADKATGAVARTPLKSSIKTPPLPKAELPIISEIASREIMPSIGELKIKSPQSEKSLEGDIIANVTMTEKTYTIQVGDKTITKSKVRISVSAPPDEGISRVVSVVMVPKEVAAHVSEIGSLSTTPTIVNPDPVIKWAFKNIPQGQTKDYTFTVNKDVQNFEILAGAQAERPSFMFRLIRWIAGFFEEKK